MAAPLVAAALAGVLFLLAVNPGLLTKKGRKQRAKALRRRMRRARR